MAGFKLTETTYSQAQQYQQELRNLKTEDWEGSFTYTLEPLFELKNERNMPTVTLRVTPDEKRLYERTYEGPNSIRIYEGSLDDEGALFGEMLLYYVSDAKTDLTEQDVRTVLHTIDDKKSWNRVCSMAKTDGARFGD